ncbi:SEC23-interacting protein [Spatholobus suberectus]|nr:SEC23-interacting protein [Spatholobus suberectus]
MYADRVESGTRRSVKERLDGNLLTDSTRQHKITGKRQRQDDKWKHDLYDDNEPRLSNRKVTAQDLRLKLQKKGLHPGGGQTGKSSVPGERDLRERLSGTMTPQPKNYDPPKPKVAAKPSSKSIDVETPAVHIKRPANPTPKKLSRKADTSLDEFLQSLGLEKYLISFQAEEVDMTALNHMTDEDLKAMGIPMGPRKKILLALESKG